MTDSFDPSEFNNWSDTAEAEYKLPDLVRRLVLATLPAPPTRIDMPSGSSVRLPGWDGLLEVVRGNAWAPDGVSGWEFSCDKRITSKANVDYEKRTAAPLDLDKATATFVFVTSRRWPEKRHWVQERRAECEWREVRAYDADDLVAWLSQDPGVTRWFAKVTGRPSFDYEAVNRIEERQIEILNKMTAGFAEMSEVQVGLRGSVKSIAMQAERSTTESIQDSEQQEVSNGIDAARKLMQQGLIVTARTHLEQIERDAGELPDSLRFRLVTNLAICALGEDEFDEASNLLNEAYRIQPQDQTGITNAALAALLQQNPRRAAELAQQALKLDQRDSNAAANLIWALWDLEEIEQLEDFVAGEEWIRSEPSSASAVARIRARQARFQESITIYQSLTESRPG